tara:strand:+ start:651 stop:1376 length:726 start_codon:yes stop_codon:yes gene_type:complete
MSLEDIDKKFDKVARHLGQTQVEKNSEKKPEPEPEAEEKETYQSKMKKSNTTGLLAVFESHLQQQLKKTDEQREKHDDAFRTIDLTTTETTTENEIEKVTEEEISSLIKVVDKSSVNTETKMNVNVDNQVFSQRRYGDNYQPIENVASASDLQIYPEKVTEASTPPTQARYSDTKQTIDNSASVNDVSQGLQPVNKIVKETDQSNTKSVDPKIIEHIKQHKAKRDAERGNLPDNYQVESKN